jgi:hypothetical protein
LNIFKNVDCGKRSILFIKILLATWMGSSGSVEQWDNYNIKGGQTKMQIAKFG